MVRWWGSRYGIAPDEQRELDWSPPRRSSRGLLDGSLTALDVWSAHELPEHQPPWHRGSRGRPGRRPPAPGVPPPRRRRTSRVSAAQPAPATPGRRSPARAGRRPPLVRAHPRPRRPAPVRRRGGGRLLEAWRPLQRRLHPARHARARDGRARPAGGAGLPVGPRDRLRARGRPLPDRLHLRPVRPAGGRAAGGRQLLREFELAWRRELEPEGWVAISFERFEPGRESVEFLTRVADTWLFRPPSGAPWWEQPYPRGTS
jgi:hypothetical protein